MKNKKNVKAEKKDKVEKKVEKVVKNDNNKIEKNIIKDKVLEYAKEKKNVLIILGIALLIVIIGIVIVVSVLGRETPGNEKTEEPSIKNTTEILEGGKIEVTDFNIKYKESEERWYLSMNINNGSNEEIDLKDYSLRLYEDKTELVVLPGTTLGVVPPKTSVVSIIILEKSFSKTNYIEIFKKEEEKSK